MNIRNFNHNIINSNLNDNETLFWQAVNDIDWSSDDNEYTMSQYLQLNFDVETITDMQRIECEKRNEMENFIKSYLKSLKEDEREKFTLDDEGIFDLASHIVGMGKTMYKYVKDNPNVIFHLQNNYKSCFEYGFDDAIFALNSY